MQLTTRSMSSPSQAGHSAPDLVFSISPVTGVPEVIPSGRVGPSYLARTERWSRSGPLCAEAGTGAAAPFPARLSPLADLLLRCAPDRFFLDEAEHFLDNRDASVATLRRCSGSSRNAVRL